jgi:type IV secretion system protein VirB11
VRGAEALDLLDAWATGHPGGVATLHGETVEGALLRLDRLAQRGGAGTSASSAGAGSPSAGPLPSQTALIAEAVRLVVVLAGGTGTGAGGRRVVALARVTGCTPDGRFLLHHYAPESDR